MYEQDEPRPEALSGLAAQLAALSPRNTLDRDRVMFVAGWAAGRRCTRWIHGAWAAAFVGLASVSALLVEWQSSSAPAMSGAVAGANQLPVNRGAAPFARSKASSKFDEASNFRMLRASLDDCALRSRPQAVTGGFENDEIQDARPRTLLKHYLLDQSDRL